MEVAVPLTFRLLITRLVMVVIVMCWGSPVTSQDDNSNQSNQHQLSCNVTQVDCPPGHCIAHYHARQKQQFLIHLHNMYFQCDS